MKNPRLLPSIIGIVVLITFVMYMAPSLLLPAVVGMVVLTIVGVVMVPALRKEPEAATVRGLIAGMVTGGIVMGLIGYATADPGWKDLQTISAAVIGVVGGGGAGAVLGWILGRYVVSRRPPPDL